jgi:hypothetical protein
MKSREASETPREDVPSRTMSEELRILRQRGDRDLRKHGERKPQGHDWRTMVVGMQLKQYRLPRLGPQLRC